MTYATAHMLWMKAGRDIPAWGQRVDIGDGAKREYRGKTILQRFEEKFERAEGGCWLWTGASVRGYGRFNIERRTVVTAPRAAWLLYRGPIPEKTYLCHKCDNPACVNPDHLFLGSPSDNMRDCATKGRLHRDGCHHLSKLTPEEVKEIRAVGRGYKSLAKQYGVGFITIRDIIKRQTWKHIP